MSGTSLGSSLKAAEHRDPTAADPRPDGLPEQVDEHGFRDLFKDRAIVLTDLTPGPARSLAAQVNEAVGRGDATLYTEAEIGALFDALVPGTAVGSPNTPALRLGSPAARTEAAEVVAQYLEVAVGAPEFFAEPMYVVSVTGWPADLLKPSVATSAPAMARLSVWRTDPGDTRHVPEPDASGVLFTSATFSLANSGNRTATAPKRSWKINVGPGQDDVAIAGMTRLNLKSMWNDPSQMREALAWRLFGEVGVPAPRHTFAKLALNGVYKGLFSVIEEVDKRFLREHFGANDEGNLYKAYCGDIGCASLEHRQEGGSDGGRAYQSQDPQDGTYRLKTNEDDPHRNTYDDLAELVRVINGLHLPGGDARFAGDAFRDSLEERFNVGAFLRWAGVNVLLGSWDNYFATPANYYLYNSGRRGAKSAVMDDPYFTFIPWDYDNCLGIDYFGGAWQYAGLLDWPAATASYWAKQGHPKLSTIPLVTNLLANHDYAQYYLDHVEYLLDTSFTTEAFSARLGTEGGSGLWQRVNQAAYQESDTPWGAPFTERQFTNDEVYRAGLQQNELHHGEGFVLGIHHYVRMRYDSARAQLERLRTTYPAGASGAHFPVAAEPLPPSR
jgi:hypothetical protein